MGMSGRRVVIPLFAGLLAAGMLAIGLHTAGAAERSRTQDAGNAERGQRLFLVGCAYCHGQNGEGTAQGPDLRGVGAAAADYLIAGTVFASASKPADTALLGIDGLRAIAAAVARPVLAIGGVTADRFDDVAAAGAAGVAGIGLFLPIDSLRPAP